MSMVWCVASACSGPADRGSPSERPNDAPPVRILVLDDPPLAESIERQWQPEMAGEISVESSSWEQFRADSRPAVDLLVYPVRRLGHLAERGQLVELTDRELDMEEVARRDLLRGVMRRSCRWGRETVALPLGIRVPLVVYRADAFRELELEPPRTWADYLTVAKRLSADKRAAAFLRPKEPESDAQGAVGSLVIEPAAPGDAAIMLLLRAAAYAKHPNHYSVLFDLSTMEPRIDEAPFLRALEEMLRAGAAVEVTADEALRRITGHRALLAVCWPHSRRSPEVPEDSPVEIGLATLPGSSEAFNWGTGEWEPLDSPRTVPVVNVGGRLASIAAASRQRRRAGETLAWLCGPTFGPRIARGSSAAGPVRVSHLEDPVVWLPAGVPATAEGDFAEAVRATHAAIDAVSLPRIPGQAEYMEALDRAVRSALSGEASPPAALRTAADRWREITEEHGVAQQRKAYRASLGLSD